MLLILAGTVTTAPAELLRELDLAGMPVSEGVMQRIYGSTGHGSFGVPVAGGEDMNGDGFTDYAIAAMVADPVVDSESRSNAGQVFLVLGNGRIRGNVDTVLSNNRVISIVGAQPHENTGSELLMAEVTGDEYGDLLICRQNFDPEFDYGSASYVRSGAGALTIIPGQQDLLDCIGSSREIDLRDPPICLGVTTLTGADAGDRLCIMAATGKIDNDDIPDIAVGADRETVDAVPDSGAVYVLQGGDHLVGGGVVDLADYAATDLADRIVRVTPVVNPGFLPDTSTENYHFGATLDVADLDGKGRSELIVAATLQRAGAQLGPEGGYGVASGGTANGTVYIVWDNNFDGDWPLDDPDFSVTGGPGYHSIIDGGAVHDTFGEELLGGGDYDGDGKADLFVGDLVADVPAGNPRRNAGSAHVFYNAALLKDKVFDFDTPPAGIVIASFDGPVAGAICGDTALHGDFNGDGIDDLAFASPSDNPRGREGAGTLHLILGQDSPWPASTDLARAGALASTGLDIINFYGARGGAGVNIGDMLAYSAASGDVNGDGVDDMLINEMGGDGTVTIDVGNLLLIDVPGMLEYIPQQVCFPVPATTGNTAIICIE